MSGMSFERMQAIQAEMERFEKEISGQVPQAPRIPNNMSLRFLPHSLQQRPPPGFPAGGLRLPVPPMMPGAPPLLPPRMPILSYAGSSNVVIEGPPTKYTLPSSSTAIASSNSSQPSEMKKLVDKVYGSQAESISNTVSSSGKLVTPVLPQDLKAVSARQRHVHHSDSQKPKKHKRYIRTAGGSVWEDISLSDWDPSDFRIFCGDLGNEVSDELLAKAFRKYPSFLRAKVVRDKRSNKTKGYGFVSFKDPQDFIRALREMDGKYVGNRPIKLRKSTWKDRNVEIVRKKIKEKTKLGLKL